MAKKRTSQIPLEEILYPNNASIATRDAELTTPDLDRIQRWKNKKLNETSSVNFKQTAPSIENMVSLGVEYSNAELSNEQKEDLYASTVCAATGSASPDYSRLLLSQTLTAMFKGNIHDYEYSINATNDALLAMNPTDTYEGMLCTRLVVLHNQYMHFMARVSSLTATEQSADININRATKLMRVYNETFEQLCKYRRKGEQKITIQHVNVASGGQAVVTAEFTSGVGDNAKK